MEGRGLLSRQPSAISAEFPTRQVGTQRPPPWQHSIWSRASLHTSPALVTYCFECASLVQGELKTKMLVCCGVFVLSSGCAGNLDIRPGEGGNRGVHEVRLGWEQRYPRDNSAPGQILSLPTGHKAIAFGICCWSQAGPGSQPGLMERSSWHPAPEPCCKGWESQAAQRDAVASLPSPLA